MFQDLKFGLKLLWKEKAFSAAALLTLALCIGANTAIFTILKAVILDPLPYSEPDRLVTLYNIYPGVGVTDRGANGIPDYLDRKQLTDVFDSVTLIGQNGFDVGMEGSPSRIRSQTVTPDYFQVLRVAPAIGRAFTADDAVFKKDKFAILSYTLWRDMFNSSRDVLGKDIRLSGVPYRIVGVMPRSFDGMDPEVKLWTPFAFDPKQTTDDARHSNNWSMMARLKPGVTVAYAQQRIDALNRVNINRIPQLKKLLEDAKFATKVVGTKEEMIRDVRAMLYLLQAAVAFVLLIGCVNVANLMLVRSNVRMKELAVRHSLGAGRWRLGRQMLTESLTLAVLGGVLGLVLGVIAVRLFSALGATDLPRGSNIEIDITVLGFSALLAILTGVVFGSVPVFHLFRGNLNEIFRQGGRTGTAARASLWTRSALVVCQVSLAFVLLVGAGLLTLSFGRLLSVNPGFRPQHVLTAQFSLPDVRYGDDARKSNFITTLLDGIRSTPGVSGAGGATLLPFSGSNNASAISIDGRPLRPGELPPVPGWNIIDTGYLKAMGVPLLTGRSFADSDTPETQRVVLIDHFMARKYWPDKNPIGERIRQGIDQSGKPFTIVGIVGSVKTSDLAEQNPVGQIYFYYKQNVPRQMHVVVKSDRDDPQLTAALRRQIQQADPELPVFDVKTMPERLSSSVANRKAAMVICLVFAGLALLLSAIGIYGVLAYSVTQRTREIGIRTALGAGTGDVLGMVLGHGLKLAAVGLAVGVAGALALTQLMASLLFDVQPRDPALFVAVAFGLMVVAASASLIPSWRALRIRPASALRYE